MVCHEEFVIYNKTTVPSNETVKCSSGLTSYSAMLYYFPFL